LIKSMTGYGRAEIESELINGYIEIRSKNHRYKDVKVSLPRNLLAFEIPLLKVINQKLLRGKIDVLVQINSYLQAKSSSLSLNQDLLAEYKKIFSELKSELGDNCQMDIVSTSQLRNLVEISAVQDDVDDYYTDINQSVLKALESLDTMRSMEGEKLSEVLTQFIANIKGLTEKVEAKRSEHIEEYHKKVRAKITSVIDAANLDENRIYQEIAYIIDKTDISEELDRLKSHLCQFDIIINESGAVGKKLDFLFQEINREINTIGSKANDFNIASYVVGMKNELERAREQAQNIE